MANGYNLHIITVGLMVAGSILRLWGVADVSFWNDEFFTVYFAQKPLAESLDLILIDAVHAPFYFIIVRPFADGSDFLARVPSIAFGLAAIPIVVYGIRRLYDDDTIAILAGAFIATNPIHVWMSRMSRPYALFFLLAFLVSYYFLRLLRGERSWQSWGIFFILSLVSYITHYFGVMLPLAQFLTMVFLLRNDAVFLRIWFVLQAIASIPILAWIVALSQQEALSFGIGWIPDPTLLDIPYTYWSMGSGFYGTTVWYLFGGVVLVSIGLIGSLLYVRRNWRMDAATLYWLMLTVWPVALVFFLSQVFINAYADRYFVVLLPGLMMLIIIGVRHVFQPRMAVLLLGLLMLQTTLFIGGTILSGTDEREDWDDVIAYLDEHIQPDDLILTDPPALVLPFRRYPSRIDEQNLVTIEDLEQPVYADRARVWIVFRNPNINVHRQTAADSFDPFNEPEAPTSDWLKNRTILERHEFKGLEILLIDLSSP